MRPFSIVKLSVKSVVTVGPTKYLSLSKITILSIKFLTSQFLSVNRIKK